MSARILVDTNVWIDNFDGGRATSPSSRAVLDLAKRGSVDLLFSVSSAKDVYYLVANGLKRKARQALGHLSQGDAEAARSIASACVSGMVASATPGGAGPHAVGGPGAARLGNRRRSRALQFRQVSGPNGGQSV